jgi:serine beta-lactamase-like protein LACTB, mitochondrial
MTRGETWLALMVAGVALLLVTFGGLWIYMASTPPLYPNPQDVPSVTQETPSAKWTAATEQGRQIARAGVAGQSLPGLSVAVGVNGEIVWAEGFGFGDLEKRAPVTPDTQFWIGTASVALTSAAVGTLLDEGRLKLDETIDIYVPAFAQTYAPPSPDTQWPVTLRQLMAHTSGVPNDGGDEGALYSKHCERPVDALQYFSGYERQLLFEPGTRYNYSSYGWITVSAAVEAVTGEPFLAFMQRRVFDPLGMDNTVPGVSTEPLSNRVTPYFPRFAADPRYGLHPMRQVEYSCYAGASVFLSTPTDLVRFGMAINGGTLLQPATRQLLQTSQRLASGEETGYGLGWDVEDVTLAGRQTRWVGHEGTSLGGMLASLMTFPEQGIVVSVLTNIPYGDTESIAVKIAQAFSEAGGDSVGPRGQTHRLEPEADR